jgi:hypothetical protein
MQNGTQDLGEAIQCTIDAWLQTGAAPAGPNNQLRDHTSERGPYHGTDHCPDHDTDQVSCHVPGGVGPPRGYQWKSLFLPEGTVLRSWSYGEHNYAQVQGDHIVHKGRPLTPN